MGARGRLRQGNYPTSTLLPSQGGLQTSLTLLTTLVAVCCPGGPLQGTGPWAEGRVGAPGLCRPSQGRKPRPRRADRKWTWDCAPATSVFCSLS